MTSGCRSTGASPAQAATSAPKASPTARCRAVASRPCRSSAIRRRCGISAWASPVFWDGRARSLEEQVAGPIELPDEMAQPIGPVIARLAGDPAMRARLRRGLSAVAQRRRQQPRPGDRDLRAHVRVARDPVRSLRRRRCGGAERAAKSPASGCSPARPAARSATAASPSPTHAFHDIGMPGDDRGRGAVLRLEAAEHAFKTPGLREIGRVCALHARRLACDPRRCGAALRERHCRAPDAVEGPDARAEADRRRARRSDRLPRHADERGRSRAAEHDRGRSKPVRRRRPSASARSRRTTRRSIPSTSRCRAAAGCGSSITTRRTHNVRVFDPAFDFDSGAQEPGETVEMTFPADGRFLVFCGIHPKMELYVDVGRGHVPSWPDHFASLCDFHGEGYPNPLIQRGLICEAACRNRGMDENL